MSLKRETKKKAEKEITRVNKQTSMTRGSDNLGSIEFKPGVIQIKFKALMDKVREEWSRYIPSVVYTFIDPEKIRKALSDIGDGSEEIYMALGDIENYEELIEYFSEYKIIWIGRSSDALYVLTAKTPHGSYNTLLTLYSIPLEMIVKEAR